MNPMKRNISSFTAMWVLLVICSATAISQNQNSGADIERLAQQLQAVEAKAKEISSSAPETQQVYIRALSRIETAFCEITSPDFACKSHSMMSSRPDKQPHSTLLFSVP
jgi:hypothetical protein